jgi:hypothetical protein
MPRPIALAPAIARPLWDALVDAEREVLKLRRLLVVKLCDCRPMASTLPLEPVLHSLPCRYRKALS